MKSAAFTILCLSAVAFSYGQSEETVDTLRFAAVDAISKSLLNEPISVAPDETVSKIDYDLLERKLNYSEFIILSLNTALTIVAVLFGFLLPLASYVFVIKPQRELKLTLTNNIKRYLESERKDTLKSAFKILASKSSSEVERRLALDDLVGCMSRPPKQGELLKIIHILENESEPHLRQDLHFLLTQKKHFVVESFYAKQWKEESVESGAHFANVYFCNYPENAVHRLLPILKDGLPATEKFFSLYNQAVNGRNKNLIRQLVDSHEIAAFVQVGVLPDMASANYTIFSTQLKALGFPEKEIQNYALIKMFMETGMLTTQNRGIHNPSDLRR